MNRIEDFLWGPWRNNGLNSDVRAILKSMEQRDSREKNSYRAVAIAAASAVIALLVAVINVIVIMQVG